MENHMSWRTVAHLNRLRLLTQLRESRKLSLLSQLVQANVGAFAPCHEEWPILCSDEISSETKVCTTWLCNLLRAKLLKTSSMTPTFNHRSGWGTLLHSRQKWWETLCIFNKCSDNQIQRNSNKPSKKTPADTWNATIEHCNRDAKSLRMSRKTMFMGTMPQAWSHNNKNQAAQSQVEPLWQTVCLCNELIWDIRIHCDIVCHKGWWSSLASFSAVLLDKKSLLWHILKLQLRWTSTCPRLIILCTVQGYFWCTQPRSDAIRVKRPDHWVRSDVVSSSLIRLWGSRSATSAPHHHLDAGLHSCVGIWYWTD